jgi:hypothetical protein
LKRNFGGQLEVVECFFGPFENAGSLVRLSIFISPHQNSEAIAKHMCDLRENAGRPFFQGMLPNAYYSPSASSQKLSGFAIARLVAFDLSKPISPVAGRHAAVFGAAVPEAAIDEDGNALFRKNEIGASGNFRMAPPTFDSGGAE